MADVTTISTKLLLPRTNFSAVIANDDGNQRAGSKIPMASRYVDNGNNTVTDRATNLIWVKDVSLLIPGDDGTHTPVIADTGNPLARWVSGRDYIVGDTLYAYGYSLMYCHTAHNSAGSYDGDSTYWSQCSPEYGLYWSAGGSYSYGTFVWSSTNAMYLCVVPGNSALSDTDRWKPIRSNNWSSSFGDYPLYAQVFYPTNGFTYNCILAHTAAEGREPTNGTYWVKNPWVQNASGMSIPRMHSFGYDNNLLGTLVTAAIADAASLVYAGRSDWRIPNINELVMSACDLTSYDAGNPTWLPHLGIFGGWSKAMLSSSLAGYVTSAYALTWGMNVGISTYMQSYFFARPVAGGF